MNQSLFSAKSKQLLTLFSLAGLTFLLSSPLKAQMPTGESESLTEAVSEKKEEISPETPSVSEESPEATATDLPQAEVTEEASSPTPEEIKLMNSSEVESVPASPSGVSSEQEQSNGAQK